MIRVAFLLVAVGLTFGFAGAAYASCIYDERSTDQQIADARVVFVGTVIDVANRNRTATFRVEEVWKGGSLPESVKVIGGPEDENAFSSVDRPFELGVRYLVFPGGESPDFTDNNCSPTREWSEDLAKYRPGGAGGPASPGPSTQPPKPSPEPVASPDPEPTETPDTGESLLTATAISGFERRGSDFGWIWIPGVGVLLAAGLAGLALRARRRRSDD